VARANNQAIHFIICAICCLATKGKSILR
jgi:hypothetical protein